LSNSVKIEKQVNKQKNCVNLRETNRAVTCRAVRGVWGGKKKKNVVHPGPNNSSCRLYTPGACYVKRGELLITRRKKPSGKGILCTGG